MSEDKASEDKFLARWSRRKQEARANTAPLEPVEPCAVQSGSVAKDEPKIDLSSLPPIDSITSATDITAFLRRGIPQELARAALRRAWSTDPVIRDFVGLAENAWDFNDPTAMPGFGPLNCSEAELAALVDRIVGGLRKSAEAPSETPVQVTDSPQVLRNTETSSVEIVAEEAAPAPVPAATQPTNAQGAESDRVSVRRRTHGSALPERDPNERS